MKDSKASKRRAVAAQAAGSSLPAKQIAVELLPNRFSRAQITGGDVLRRSINDYAKASPVSASNEGLVGYNIHTMGRS